MKVNFSVSQICTTPTFLFLLKSHVSVSPSSAKHPFNDPSTGLIRTRCPGSPLQVTTVIARSCDHLLNYTAFTVKSLRCFLCAIYTTKNRCPFEVQLLKLNFSKPTSSSSHSRLSVQDGSSFELQTPPGQGSWKLLNELG